MKKTRKTTYHLTPDELNDIIIKHFNLKEKNTTIDYKITEIWDSMDRFKIGNKLTQIDINTIEEIEEKCEHEFGDEIKTNMGTWPDIEICRMMVCKKCRFTKFL